MNEYLKAAVIGYARSGATIEQIMGLTDFKLKYWEVEEIILSIVPCVMLAENDHAINFAIENGF